MDLLGPMIPPAATAVVLLGVAVLVRRQRHAQQQLSEPRRSSSTARDSVVLSMTADAAVEKCHRVLADLGAAPHFIDVVDGTTALEASIDHAGIRSYGSVLQLLVTADGDGSLVQIVAWPEMSIWDMGVSAELVADVRRRLRARKPQPQPLPQQRGPAA
ncbi:MAG: hypothetical protein U0R68_09670 [Candidatus Nanopelagicales bacterium]